MPDESAGTDKKIIIDEDWKSQVEAEKEAEKGSVRRAGESPKPAAAQSAQTLPPPDLIFLASTLYLQAMVSLGLLPNPMAEGKSAVKLDQGKHAIDTLQVLYDKTEGNRTPEETAAIDDMLHQLRMTYVERMSVKDEE